MTNEKKLTIKQDCLTLQPSGDIGYSDCKNGIEINIEYKDRIPNPSLSINMSLVDWAYPHTSYIGDMIDEIVAQMIDVKIRYDAIFNQERHILEQKKERDNLEEEKAWVEVEQSFKPYIVVECRQISNFHPSQWEGKTDDDRYIYIKFRRGYLLVDISAPGKSIRESFLDQTYKHFGKKYGDKHDGTMGTEEMKNVCNEILEFKCDFMYAADLECDEEECNQAWKERVNKNEPW